MDDPNYSGQRFVVACDSDYYSAVRYCHTREEADAIAAAWVERGGTGESYYPSRPYIVIAEIAHAIALPAPTK